MIHVPESEEGHLLRVMGIDPGSETLGVAELVYDLHLKRIVSCIAETYSGTKLSGDQLTNTFFEHRYLRIRAHQSNLERWMQKTEPHLFACESPFFNRFRPAAYEVLLDVVEGVKCAVKNYDSQKEVFMIAPSVVKKSVGGGAYADKNEMREKVSSLPALLNAGVDNFDVFDEHSIDAIAVAYARLQDLLRSL